MTARDVHAAALERSRKRAALRAWNMAVVAWRLDEQPRWVIDRHEHPTYVASLFNLPAMFKVAPHGVAEGR